MKISFKTAIMAGTILAALPVSGHATVAYYTDPNNSVTYDADYFSSNGPITYTVTNDIPQGSGTQYTNTETWTVNSDLASNGAGTDDAYSDAPDWGSPGVGNNYATYSAGTANAPNSSVEGAAAIGFEITFTGSWGSTPAGEADDGATNFKGLSQSALTWSQDNGCNTGYGTDSGTQFCNYTNGTPTSPPTGGPLMWNGQIVGGDGGSAVVFLSPSSSSNITAGSNYYVNVFMNGNGSGSGVPTGFTGAWLYAYTAPPPAAPEPASLSVIGIGMLGLAAVRRRRRK